MARRGSRACLASRFVRREVSGSNRRAMAYASSSLPHRSHSREYRAHPGEDIAPPRVPGMIWMVMRTRVPVIPVPSVSRSSLFLARPVAAVRPRRPANDDDGGLAVMQTVIADTPNEPFPHPSAFVRRHDDGGGPSPSARSHTTRRWTSCRDFRGPPRRQNECRGAAAAARTRDRRTPRRCAYPQPDARARRARAVRSTRGRGPPSSVGRAGGRVDAGRGSEGWVKSGVERKKRG